MTKEKRLAAKDAFEYLTEGENYEAIGRAFESAWSEHSNTILSCLSAQEPEWEEEIKRG